MDIIAQIIIIETLKNETKDEGSHCVTISLESYGNITTYFALMSSFIKSTYNGLFLLRLTGTNVYINGERAVIQNGKFNIGSFFEGNMDLIMGFDRGFATPPGNFLNITGELKDNMSLTEIALSKSHLYSLEEDNYVLVTFQSEVVDINYNNEDVQTMILYIATFNGVTKRYYYSQLNVVIEGNDVVSDGTVTEKGIRKGIKIFGDLESFNHNGESTAFLVTPTELILVPPFTLRFSEGIMKVVDSCNNEVPGSSIVAKRHINNTSVYIAAVMSVALICFSIVSFYL
jgi:hypothetical protein